MHWSHFHPDCKPLNALPHPSDFANETFCSAASRSSSSWSSVSSPNNQSIYHLENFGQWILPSGAVKRGRVFLCSSSQYVVPIDSNSSGKSPGEMESPVALAMNTVPTRSSSSSRSRWPSESTDPPSPLSSLSTKFVYHRMKLSRMIEPSPCGSIENSWASSSPAENPSPSSSINSSNLVARRTPSFLGSCESNTFAAFAPITPRFSVGLGASPISLFSDGAESVLLYFASIFLYKTSSLPLYLSRRLSTESSFDGLYLVKSATSFLW
mmetsp:Transcript_34723/g.51600  ORF Transcript_34723/g.51600 Transcript_34723/m.51600 type:complete len:268 (+) Transcript_34723:1631-2434(+)